MPEYQANYIEANPWHESFKIENVTKEMATVSIEVIINEELLMLIRSHGSRIKVLSPTKLSKMIREDIGRQAEMYDKGSEPFP